MHDLTFPCMGSQARVMVDGPPAAADTVRAWLEAFEVRLSRFREDSELSALNRDPRERVPASPLLRDLVAAGLWAAQRTGGLVDPTLLGDIERAGYAASRSDARRTDVAAALAAAPPRRPARPDLRARWRSVTVDGEAITRPRGLRLDPGGIGKGLAADSAARLLDGHEFVVDCGGDLRVGGPPRRVTVEHPLTGGNALHLNVTGGIATSGIGRRAWWTDHGPAHHVLDPSTGEPAWTGLLSVTALAPTTLEAEVLAKAALLSGPAGALLPHGGVLFHDDGRMQLAGSLARPRIRSAA